MASLIRNPKDFWSGLIFAVAGAAAVLVARGYPMGSAARMGPAYFPTVLGGLLALIGLVAIVRSLLRPGEAIEPFALKETFLVLLATVLFGVLLRGAGLFAAVLVLVMLSGFASIKFNWKPFLAVAVGLAVFSVLVFVKFLGLPIVMFGPWLGF
jgi:Tripartite tricarboxylate transporter TctB family